MELNDNHFSETAHLRSRVVISCGILSLLLYLSGIFIWLTPLPILYAYKKGRWSRGLLAMSIALLCLLALYKLLIPWATVQWGSAKVFEFFFWVPGISAAPSQNSTDPMVFGISYYTYFGVMGALLGEFEQGDYGMTRLVAQTTGILMVGLLLWLFWYTHGDILGLIHDLETYFVDLMKELTKAPANNEDIQAQLALLQAHLPRIAYYTVHLLPSMVVNSTLFVIWLNVVVARKLFQKEIFFPGLGPLRQWRLSFMGVWIVIGVALLFLLDVYVLHVGYLKLVALNTFVIFALIYFFQGLAIVVFYTLRWSLSPLIRMMLYAILLLFFQPVGLLLVAFGFFDSWFDFRRLTPKVAKL
jgi:predicted membrane protein DUF2232